METIIVYFNIVLAHSQGLYSHRITPVKLVWYYQNNVYLERYRDRLLNLFKGILRVASNCLLCEKNLKICNDRRILKLTVFFMNTLKELRDRRYAPTEVLGLAIVDVAGAAYRGRHLPLGTGG